MIAVIRISGQVNIRKDVAETLNRIRLRRKFTMTLLEETPENEKLLKKIRNHIAYGKINEETMKQLKEKRGATEKKNFFRLHPPRGGIDSKKHFGVTRKAVLGDNKEKINDLIMRML